VRQRCLGGHIKLYHPKSLHSRRRHESRQDRRSCIMTSPIDWIGRSGRTYRYWFLDSIVPEGIRSVAGNYAFVKQLPNERFVPLYFGQASDLRDRLPTHERCYARDGAFHTRRRTGSPRRGTRSDISVESFPERPPQSGFVTTGTFGLEGSQSLSGVAGEGATPVTLAMIIF
jgi:hypothetical protein